MGCKVCWRLQKGTKAIKQNQKKKEYYWGMVRISSELEGKAGESLKEKTKHGEEDEIITRGIHVYKAGLCCSGLTKLGN